MSFLEIYFDNAATTMVCSEAVEEACRVMSEFYGNPSSLHNKGLEIEKKMRHAREQVAKAWGVGPSEIYFTSGGTESNNITIAGALLKGSKWGNRVITTKMEHPAVLEVIEHYAKVLNLDITYLDVLESGLPDLEKLKEVVDEKVILLSMMHANNETGCLLPVKEAVKIVKKAAPRAFAHCDMVQSFGKTGVSPAELGVDFAALSGHKIHAPKGVGAMYIKKGVSIPTTVFGGGQEKNIRSGTENTPGICALGIAAEIAMKNLQENIERMARVKKIIADGALENIENCRINGENTSPCVLNMSFVGVRSEILLHSMEAKGVYVSSGSACSSNHPSPSRVLTAMGLKPNEIDGSIRFSFSRYNTEEEAEMCLMVLIDEVKAIRGFYR